jgi:hypothetical protein
MITRESSYAAFAKAFPEIMDRALAKQKPYRDAFLNRIGISFEDLVKKSESERQVIENLWKESIELKELKNYGNTDNVSNPSGNQG